MHNIDIIGVTVLDANGRFVSSVHPALARKLLKHKFASINSASPFIIQLTQTVSNAISNGSESLQVILARIK